MDAATFIVAALVGGLSAGTTSVVEQAIKDAYNGLKALIVRNYSNLSVSVDYLEAAPDKDVRQASVAEDLRISKADANVEILEHAQVLMEAVKAHSADLEQRKTAEFIIETFRGRNMDIEDVDVRGADPKFSIKDIDRTGDLTVKGVKVWQINPKD